MTKAQVKSPFGVVTCASAWVPQAVLWFRTSRSHVSRHPGVMSPEIPE